MHCAHCEVETSARPCEACGRDPWIAERYELLRVLGRGANGTIWVALDHERGDQVAIKDVPLRAGPADPVALLEQRGAQVMRQIRHRSVPTWRDTRVEGHGKARSLYVVQELIEGPNLEQELADRRYTAEDALELADELLGVLEYLHGLSPPVLHRDIKPANLLRRADGTLVLIDFGSVRDALQDAALGGHTVTGTFGYMAPEQFAGDATPATDLYGVGATLLHLLSRRPPAGLVGPHGRLDWEHHIKVPTPVIELLRALLQPDPARRPGSAAEARQRVRAALRSVGRPEVELMPVTPVGHPRPPRVIEREAVVSPFPEAEPEQVPARRDASAVTNTKANQRAIAFAALFMLFCVISAGLT